MWSYHGLFCQHLRRRLEHFRGRIDSATSTGPQREVLEGLIRRGFTCRAAPRNVAVALYATSLAFLASELAAEVLVARGSLSFATFTAWVYASVGAAALLFSAASVYFMSWVARATREHEYHELLLARFVRDPAGFRTLPPSAKFTRRWNRHHSRVLLFLVLAVPLTLSPVVAVRQVHQAMSAGAGLTAPLTGWVVALFVFAAIFHVAGTHVLLGMHNGHLRVEEVNRQLLVRASEWVPERTQAVLDESPGGGSDPGELLPRRVLATIMITDIVGFSRAMETSEEDMYRKLVRHNEIVRRCLARHGGTEVKTMGDAFLVRFADAARAVDAAIEIQRELSRDGGAERIEVRIGIHTGEILMLDGDILGTVVNVTARIEPLAEVGGICLTADTWQRVRASLAVEASSIGRRPLKNIAGAPELFMIPRSSIAGEERRKPA